MLRCGFVTEDDHYTTLISSVMPQTRSVSPWLETSTAGSPRQIPCSERMKVIGLPVWSFLTVIINICSSLMASQR